MAIFDNLGGGEDISVIETAIEGKGIEVPEGSSLSDMAAIITNELMHIPTTDNGVYNLGTVSPNSSKTVNISFTKIFTSAPSVVSYATGSDSEGDVLYDSDVTISNITTTGFTAKTTNPRGGSTWYNVKIIWSASL